MFDRRLLLNFDWFLFLLVAAISLLGVAAIYSASQGYTDPTQFWLRQLVWIGIGMGAGLIVLFFDLRTIGNLAYIIHGSAVFSLMLLSVYGSGLGGNSVNRWFAVGPVAVQPSEFVKLTMVLAIAQYFSDARRVGNLKLRGIFWPATMMFVPFFLIVRQPDLGTALLLVMIFIPLILLAGVRPRIVLAAACVGLIGVALLVASFKFGYYLVDEKVSEALRRSGAPREALAGLEGAKGQRFYQLTTLRERILAAGKGKFGEAETRLIEEKSYRTYISHVLRPYQQKRLITFINPDFDPLGAGYHVIQSKVAIGSGKFWGKGYRQSTQGSLNFLPARHTDFIFSIFSEEWGFAGAAGLILLYLVLILRAISIMLQTHDRFSSFLIMGSVSIITFQVLINMGMALGLLPVVGVPLPFFSYGGSSMISVMVAVGLILNIRMRRFLWS